MDSMSGGDDKSGGVIVEGHFREEMPTYDARALTAGGQLAGIMLDDQLYTLRITKAGKLILTK